MAAGEELLLTAIGTLTGVCALVVTIVIWRSDQRRAREGLLEDLRGRVIALETKVEPLWRDVRFAAMHAATSLLHSPENELGLDEYIDRFLAGTLGREQAQEFMVLLKKVRETGPSEAKRHAADVLLREVERRSD